jgi:hypothetical protein
MFFGATFGPFPAVRPLRRAPDRDESLHALVVRRPDGLVDVVEPVRSVEGVLRVRGTLRRRIEPVDRDPDDARMSGRGARDDRQPIFGVAEVLVVLEAEVHPGGSVGADREREGGDAGESDQEAETAQANLLFLAGRAAA